MSMFPSPWRRLGPVAATVAALALVAAIPASAQEEASPEPPASAEASMPGPSMSPASPAPDDPVIHPIPDAILPVPPDISTVSLEPESAPSMTVGEPVPYALGHCGLLSPIDVNGSFWWPVGGVAPDGGPIASDEGIGELINATDGVLLLTSDDEATFTTVSGSVIYLERVEGAVDYPLCM